MNFQKIILYFTIISGFFGSAFLNFNVGLFSLFPFRIFLLLLWLIFICGIFLKKGKLNIFHIKIKKYLLFLLFWLYWAILSFGWAGDKGEAIREITFLFMGCFLIFFIIFYFINLKDLKRFYYIWITVLIILIPIGIWEHLTGCHLKISGLAETIHPIAKFMPTTVFHNSNDFATFLGLTFPFILSWLHYKKRLKNKIFGFILLGTSFYLLLATESRANLLAFILIIFIFFLFLLNLNKKIKWLIAGGLVFSFLLLFSPVFTQQIFSQIDSQLQSFTSEYQRTIGSNAVRINLTKDAIYYLFHSYGFGVGAGNIEWHIANFSPHDTSGILNLHNWWMEILANYGIFIFIGYLLFYFNLIYNFWKIWHQKLNINEKIICETLLLSLIGFSIASISSSSIMAFKPQWFLFGFSLAFLNYIRIKNIKTIKL